MTVVPLFPQSLPANSVIGRLGVGAGPSETIPFGTLAGYLSTPVFNVKAYGAKGDGVTDDSAAIAAANAAAVTAGGGTVYFPAGHYINSQLFVNNVSCVVLHNFIEYVGEGYASFLDFQDNCFCTPPPSLGRTNYAALTVYPANNVSVGDQQVTTTTPANAGNFAPGDIIMIWSTTGLVETPGDTEPYYIEHNRVVSANASTGVIRLEDQIEDAWPNGAGGTAVQVSKVTSYFAQNTRVANLRLRGAYINGSAPFKCGGTYKGIFEDCFCEGVQFITGNAYVRTVFRNLYGLIYYASTGYPGWPQEIGNAVELATGCNRTRIENCFVEIVSWDGTAFGTGNPGFIFYFNEYARRTMMKNFTLLAPGLNPNFVFDFSTPMGEEIDGIFVHVNSCSQFINWFNNLVPSNILIPVSMRNVRVVVENSASPQTFSIFILATGPMDMEFTNFTLVKGAPTYAIEVNNAVTTARFRNITSPGQVWFASGSPPAAPYDIEVTDSAIGPPLDVISAADITYHHNTRFGLKLPLQTRVLYQSFNNTVEIFPLQVTLAAHEILCQGDYIDITADVLKVGAVGGATLTGNAFGATIFTITVPATNNTPVVIRWRIYFNQGGSFQTPANWYASGYYSVGNTFTAIEASGTYDATTAWFIGVGGSSANAADSLVFQNAKIGFVQGELT